MGFNIVSFYCFFFVMSFVDQKFLILTQSNFSTFSFGFPSLVSFLQKPIPILKTICSYFFLKVLKFCYPVESIWDQLLFKCELVLQFHFICLRIIFPPVRLLHRPSCSQQFAVTLLSHVKTSISVCVSVRMRVTT